MSHVIDEFSPGIRGCFRKTLSKVPHVTVKFLDGIGECIRMVMWLVLSETHDKLQRLCKKNT